MLDKFKQTFARHKPPAWQRCGHDRAAPCCCGAPAIGVAVFLILFAVVGFFAVPPIARYYLAKELTERARPPGQRSSASR